MGSSQSSTSTSTSTSKPTTTTASTSTGSRRGGTVIHTNPVPYTGPSLYPTPTGHEYDEMDELAKKLPLMIDDATQQQVQEYRAACGAEHNGPMVACFATGEYLSLYERKHKEAVDLYRNVCFRPSTDTSPNGVKVDGTKAYPPGCFNLAKMLMTAKGTAFAPLEAYHTFDRACRGGHAASCFIQAQILCTRPKSLGGDPGIPHDPQKAMDLYQHVCDDPHNDSVACFTLASMLLRGAHVSRNALNVSPQEARGEAPIVQRENEPDRTRASDEPYIVVRDPVRAEQLFLKACNLGSHPTSCYNLAVMYTQGDTGVPANAELAAEYKKKTQANIRLFGDGGGDGGGNGGGNE